MGLAVSAPASRNVRRPASATANGVPAGATPVCQSAMIWLAG